MDVDREADGHGQLLATSKALSQNVLFYFRLRWSLRQLRCPGRTLFLSYQLLYSDCPTMSYLYFVSYQPSSPHLGGY